MCEVPYEDCSRVVGHVAARFGAVEWLLVLVLSAL